MSMSLLERLKLHPNVIKWSSWEYWPVKLTYIPVVIMWAIQALRSKRIAFFTNVNPSIPTSGLFGESKINIMKHIPEEYLPESIFTGRNAVLEDVLEEMKDRGIVFPCVAKPDIGERGLLVEVIENEEQLAAYLLRTKMDTIVQTYVDYPLELSVLCYQVPGTDEAGITSVCEKEFLHVTGDGESTLEELISRYPRAVLQQERLATQNKGKMTEVIPTGKVIQLEPIGNHCRGTKFLNANHYIDSELETTMLSILKQMDGFYYGRFDLRAKSIESLKSGQDFYILEFNGVASEPAHIYSPAYPVVKAYRDLWHHAGIMRRISDQLTRSGIVPMKVRDILSALSVYRKYLRNAKAIPTV